LADALGDLFNDRDNWFLKIESGKPFNGALRC
jgi:hypothetical protein